MNIKFKNTHAILYLRNRKNEVVGKAKIDLEDAVRVKDYTWLLHKDGYAYNSKLGPLKSFILESEPKSRYLNLNNDLLDCRKHNLKMLRKPIKLVTQYTPNRIKIKEKYALLYLRNKKQELVGKARIDLADVERVSQYKWCLSAQGYAFSGKVGYLHRFIVDADDYTMYDHKNRNKLDCRRKNLRPCTHLENTRNNGVRSHSTSGIKGVHKYAEDRYKVTIRVRHAQVSLGIFYNPIDAAKAYNKAAKEHFGEFAVLNNIKELKIKFDKE